MPEMFELHNNATIGELKQKLEVKVGLPLARLNVQSFHKSLENDEFITNLLRIPDKSDYTYPSTTLNGTAFSLYHENSFVGFLQFYTIPEGKSQLDFLNMPKSSMLLPVDRLPQFCEASNSQDSSASSASNQTNASFESASTSASSVARKTRVCASDEESAAKRCVLCVITIYVNDRDTQLIHSQNTKQPREQRGQGGSAAESARGQTSRQHGFHIWFEDPPDELLQDGDQPHKLLSGAGRGVQGEEEGLLHAKELSQEGYSAAVCEHNAREPTLRLGDN